MADQTVVPFQPQYSAAPQTPAPQQQYIPPMQASPQTAASSYVPPQQSYMPQQQAPMGSGLGSYFQQLSAQNAAPQPSYSAASTGAPSTGAYSYNPASGAELLPTGTLSSYFQQLSPQNAAPQPSYSYNPATQAYTQNQPTAAASAASAANAWSHPVIGYDYESDSPQYGPWTNNATGAKQWNDPNVDPHSLERIIGDEGNKAGGSIRSSYASGGSVSPQGLASLGRGQDSMLVHMTPGEVQGLQQLAMKHGGSLTINPHTGLPEAGILSALLPMAAGFALGPAGFGLMSSLGAAATVGGLGALASGSLSKGLMAGLSAYGGSELASGLSSVGADQANKLAVTDLEKATEAATASTGSASADTAFKQAQQANIDSLVNQAAANPNAMAPEAYRDFLNTVPPTPEPAQIQGFQRDAMQQLMQNNQLNPATQKALANPMSTGLGQLTEKGGMSALGSKLGYGGAAAIAAPLLYGMTQQKQNTLAPLPGQKIPYQSYAYNQGTVNPYFGQPGNKDPYYLDQGYTRTAAQGGLLDSMEQNSYPQARLPLQHMVEGGVERLAGGGEPRFSREIHDNDSTGVMGMFKNASPTALAQYKKAARNASVQAAAIDELNKRANAAFTDVGADTEYAAHGGLMGLQEYAAGGKLLRGPGDGMSDSIPAVIKGAKPQRAALADGEFVIPADVVSHLGNGSTEAGAKRLYAMMDKVRHARTGNPKQGKQINPERFMPA